MWHISFDPQQKFQTLNRIIALFFNPQIRSTPKEIHTDILHRPALCEKKLQSENLFHTQFYQIFSSRLALILGLFTFTCSPFRPFNLKVEPMSANTIHTATFISHRYNSTQHTHTHSGIYSRVCFALRLRSLDRVACWLAFGIHIDESTIVGKNSFEACFKPSTSTVAASGQLRRRDVSERYEYSYIYLHPSSSICCVYCVGSLRKC